MHGKSYQDLYIYANIFNTFWGEQRGIHLKLLNISRKTRVLKCFRANEKTVSRQGAGERAGGEA